MQLPSINYLYQQAKNSALRFPFTLKSALIGVLLGIYLVEHESEMLNTFPYLNVMLCAALGVPLFFCINVFSDKQNVPSSKSILIKTGGIVLLGGLYFTLPGSEETASTSLPYIRYAIYNIALHLIVSFAPYLKQKQLNGFWQYNRLLFTRIVLSAIYSGFLFVGVMLALGAMHLLFDVEIPDKLPAELWIFIVGFFNTWFFVAGMPENYDELDKIAHYPFGLKVFTQYILLPLLMLYLLILYAYGAKIVALWDWPKGVVSYLIVCVAVLGIFVFLMIYPYGQKEENSWIKKFSKAYYFILLPLVALLFIAITMRLGDYGITINRYIILLLGIWLTLVCIYFMIGKTNIKFIPVSLSIMIVLMSFGPWSMFSVSEKSQANRLKHILEENGLLKDGKVVNEQKLEIDSNYYSQSFVPQNKQLLTDSLNNEVKSILDYLDDYHGFNAIKSWYNQDLIGEISHYNLQKKRWERLNESEIFMRALGLDYSYVYLDNENRYFSYSAVYQNNLRQIKGYDYMIKFNYYQHAYNYQIVKFELEGNQYELKNHEKDSYLVDVLENDKVITTIDFNPLKQSLFEKYGKTQKYDLPQQDLTIIGSSNEMNYKLELENMSFNKEEDELILTSVNGVMFFNLKEKLKDE